MHMTWRIRFLTSALIVMLVTCTAVAAEYGARAYGMGGAYNALSSDVTGLAYNPAGLGRRSFDVLLSVGSPDQGIWGKLRSALDSPADLGQNYDAAGLAAVGIGPVAVGFLVDGKYEITEDNDNKVIDTRLNQRISLGTGLNVVSFPLSAGELRMGLRLQRIDAKHRRFVVDANDSKVTETAWNGAGYSLGVGALAQITEMVTVGITVHDLLAKTHWTGTTSSQGVTIEEDPYTENHTAVTGGSLAIRVPFTGVTLAIDGDTTGTVRYGAESNFLFNALSLRAGQTRPRSGPVITTAGLGVNLGPLSGGIAVGARESFEALDMFLVDAAIRF
ncbi:MAG: hypothetical protein ACOYEP_05285 [Limnochordia bacterium]|jgi:hypothetical protein